MCLPPFTKKILKTFKNYWWLFMFAFSYLGYGDQTSFSKFPKLLLHTRFLLKSYFSFICPPFS